MKILIVTETLVTGGAETFVVRLSNAFAKEHEVFLFNLHPEISNKTLIGQLDSRVKVTHLRVPLLWFWLKGDSMLRKLRMNFSFFDWFAVKFLAKQLQRIKPDVVHSHLFKTDNYVDRSRKGQPLNHVITVHGDYIEYIKKGETHFFGAMKRVLEHVHKVVVISEEQRNILTRYYPAIEDKLFKIYNGYFLRNGGALIKKDRPFTFGMIARGLPEKGWEYAIAAFARISNPDIRLLLYGESNFLDELKAKNVDPRIEFAGFTNDPLAAIAQMDVGLFPSYYQSESLPTTIIEYLLMHKPVFTTPVGECALMIEHQGQLAGRVIPLLEGKPDVDILYKDMERITGDRVWYEAMAYVAEHAKVKFDMDVCTNAYLAVYKNNLCAV